MTRSHKLASLCAAGFITGALAQPSAAHAQPQEAASAPAVAATDDAVAAENDEIRRLYRAGSAAFEAGRLEEARRLLLQAWALRHTYDLAIALGQVELALKQPRDAAEHLDFALRNFPPQLSADTLQLVRDAFSQAEKSVGTLILRVDHAGAQVSADGRVVGTAPLGSPVFLEPGTHTLVAQEGGNRVTRTLLIEASKTQSLSLELDAAGPGEPPSTGATPERSERPTVKPGLLIAGGAAVVVGAGVGVGFALAARSEKEHSDALRASLSSSACYPAAGLNTQCAELQEAVKTHDRNRDISSVGFAVAGTALVATVAYWAFSRTESQKSAKRTNPVHLGASATERETRLWLSGAF